MFGFGPGIGLSRSWVGAVDIRVGDIIAGKYRVEKILGKGGMGVVVAARHIELGELRAIKFMLPEGLANAEAVERFRREAKAASRLKSIHAVKIYDIDRLEQGALFIVMEHLEGMDLKELAKTRGVLALQEASLFILQACEALGEAHAAGIIHRDLKSANLFLTKGPRGEPCIKVLDFGIAKVKADADGGQAELTHTKLVLGSPAFMSPEQARSARLADARSDIWALGVILYRLVTGVLPFDGHGLQAIFLRILDSAPAQPPSAYNPAMPPEFDAVVLRCLEKDPARRYASTSQLAEALRPFAAQDVAAAPSNAVADEMQTWIRPAQTRPGDAPFAGGPPSSIRPFEPQPRVHTPAELAPIPADPNLSARSLPLPPLRPSPSLTFLSSLQAAPTERLPIVEATTAVPLVSAEKPAPRPSVERDTGLSGRGDDSTGAPWSTPEAPQRRERRSISLWTIVIPSVILSGLVGALGLWIGLGMRTNPSAGAPEPTSTGAAPDATPSISRDAPPNAPPTEEPTKKVGEHGERAETPNDAPRSPNPPPTRTAEETKKEASKAASTPSATPATPGPTTTAAPPVAPPVSEPNPAAPHISTAAPDTTPAKPPPKKPPSGFDEDDPT